MKISKKLIALILAALAAFVMLAACGSGEGGADIRGEVKECGNISVFVPEGSSLESGSLIVENDPDSVWILLDSNRLHYYLIGVVDGRETAEGNLAATQETNAANGGEGPVTVDVNGVTWTGYAYKYSDADCFQLYAEIDGKWIMVSAAYHAYNSDETVKVLGSIKVK